MCNTLVSFVSMILKYGYMLFDIMSLSCLILKEGLMLFIWVLDDVMICTTFTASPAFESYNTFVGIKGIKLLLYNFAIAVNTKSLRRTKNASTFFTVSWSLMLRLSFT